ncbi:hypothetical protein V5N11_032349 [Cardamine amara subsp. amara]|uniref:DUF4283 domain-containing protein n=1 Tax=Cardamine amara subsp. amara TaxID=228776 RepID=A0ABD1BR98_CARAN
MAPVTIADSGRPRVLILDEVFQRGAELHKDFIICYFNGRPPPYSQIQSVLSHMWGKGRKVEIHMNQISRSMLVRIPNDFIRQKILEKKIWYVGDSMFHAVQWSSNPSTESPSMSSIQIWAHLKGIPLDLRHRKGLSLVACLVGEPKETDEFTINLVSLTLAHVKVEVNLTEPFPRVVEFQRQNRQVVEVEVDYPWLPPTCSHCKELGHIVKNCLQLPPLNLATKKHPNQKSSKGKEKHTTLPTPTSKEVKSIPKVTVGKGIAQGESSSSSSAIAIDQPTFIVNPPPIINDNPVTGAALSLVTAVQPGFNFITPPDLISSSQVDPVSPISKTPNSFVFSAPSLNYLPDFVSSSGEPIPSSPSPEIIKKPSLKRSRSSPVLNSRPIYTFFNPFSHEVLPQPLLSDSPAKSNTLSSTTIFNYVRSLLLGEPSS